MQLMQPMAIAEGGLSPSFSVANQEKAEEISLSGGTDVLKDSGWRQSHLSGWLEYCRAYVRLLVVPAVLVLQLKASTW